MRTKIARHIMLVIATLLAVVAVAVVPSTGAQAQGACSLPAQYQGSATFGANVTTAAPGSTIVYTGSGWPANTSIPITINGAAVGSTTTNASSQFSFSYVVPSGASGSLTATANCGGFTLSASVSVSGGTSPTVTVISTPRTVTTASSLPVTGSQSLGMAQIALALLAAGGLLLLLARRRSASDS